MTLTTEFSDVHVKASLTGCRFTLSTEGTFSRLSETQEQYIDECLCKEENGNVFYRKIVPVKTVPSSSSEAAFTPSSSSEEPKSSSSSVKVITPSEAKTGALLDQRDGREYRTVTIGSQTWMAENLAYVELQKTAVLDSSSFCADNDPENCEKYGRLYLWSAAMDSVGKFSNEGKGCGTGSEQCPIKFKEVANVRGICPEGWVLPTVEDFEELFRNIGGTEVSQYPEWENVEEKLKSDSLWKDYEEKSGNGTNDYGFNVLPVGRAVFFDNDPSSRYYLTVHSYDFGEVSFFWTTYHYNAFVANTAGFRSYHETADIIGNDMEGFNPVRCIKK